MKNKQTIHTLKIFLFGLFLVFGCDIREVEDLQPLAFPGTPEVFIDDFTSDLAYAAFGGSDVKAFEVDREETYNGSLQSMRFAVPDANSPNGAFAGGVFFSKIGRNLSGYNALTFYIKATQPVSIGELGFGNDLGQNKFVVSLANTPVNTNWQKVIIPIPDASKLIGEKGLFYYSAGPENGRGYTFWVDEVRFEKLPDLGNITGTILNGQDQVIDKAETGDKFSINGLQATALLPSGVNQTVNASPYYFTFKSSDSGIAGVDDKGMIMVVDAGTTTITAKLGEQDAKGSLQLTSTGAPVGPTTVASAPPNREPEDVISLFSNAYSNVPVDSWNRRYLFSNAEEFFIEVEGDDVIRYRNLNFVGIEFLNPTVNASGMTHFHIDIWTPNPINSNTEFKVFLADLGAEGQFGGDNDKNHEVTISSSSLSSSNWVGIDIPLSAFTGLTSRANLGQMILSGSLPNLYIDNVYFYRNPVTPLTAAPSPNKASENVLSIFSDSYTNVAGTDFNPNWGQSGFSTAGQTLIAGNNTLSYPNFNYQGIQLGSSQNVSSYGFLHLDYYSTNATSLNVFLISPGPVEKPFALNVPTAGWNSVDIPLSSFSPVNLAEIIQFKFDGGNGGANIFIDNIYFWKNPAPPTVPNVAAPTPTRPAGDVLSIFSDTYTTAPNPIELTPYWGQPQAGYAATVTPIAGNNTLFYDNFNYQGIDFSSSSQNVSEYQFLHIDYYSANATTLNVYLINIPVEAPYALTVPTAGWNSVDIPLSAFTGVDLTSIDQFKFDGGDGSKDVYIDNIYFYKSSGGGACPTPPSGEFITDGDFEANANCWQLNNSIVSIVTNESNGGGSNSARLETVQSGAPNIKQERFGAGIIQPNTTYTVKLDIRSDAGDPLVDGAVFQVLAFSESASGATQAILEAADPNIPTTWTTRTYNFTTAANVEEGVSLLIQLTGGGAASTSGTIFIDNVSLKAQ